MDKEIRISYNFHACEILLYFDLFQPLKTIHSLRAVQKHVVGQKALVCQTLA